MLHQSFRWAPLYYILHQPFVWGYLLQMLHQSCHQFDYAFFLITPKTFFKGRFLSLVCHLSEANWNLASVNCDRRIFFWLVFSFTNLKLLLHRKRGKLHGRASLVIPGSTSLQRWGVSISMPCCAYALLANCSVVAPLIEWSSYGKGIAKDSHIRSLLSCRVMRASLARIISSKGRHMKKLQISHVKNVENDVRFFDGFNVAIAR